MTAPALIKQADVERAVKGCLNAGMKVGTVTVSPDGTVTVYSGDGADSPTGSARPNPLDRLLENLHENGD